MSSVARELVDLEPPSPSTETDIGGASDGSNGQEPLTAQPGPLPGRRRRFSNEEKRLFLHQASSPGESMSSVGRRHGLSVSLLFRWRRQLDGGASQLRVREEDTRIEVRDLRDRVRELERLLGRKTLEAELLKQELSRLGHNPSLALNELETALDARGT